MAQEPHPAGLRGPQPAGPRSAMPAVRPQGGRRFDVGRRARASRRRADARSTQSRDRRLVVRRQIALGAAVALGALLAVVGLGLLGAASRAASVPAQTTQVRLTEGESLWQLARRVAPRADTGAVVDRIVAENRLTAADLRPGRVLLVPTGE